MNKQITPETAFAFAKKVAYGHVSRFNQEFGSSLKFSPEGLARAVGVCTWLVGLQHGGKSEAEVGALAADFYKNLDYLAGYGGTTEVKHRRWVVTDGSVDGHYAEHPLSVPRYVVTLYDDATLHGFAVHWHVLIQDEARLETIDPNRVIRHGHYPSLPYAFSHHGGLIYHGPGRGETFTVSLTDQFWGVHT